MARSIDNKSKSYLILIILLSVTYMIACKGVRVGTEVGNPAFFSSWNELETYIKGEFSESILPSDVYESEIGLVPAGLSDVANDYSTGNYSRTNIQEIGVDESDKVKSDGTYLYIAGDNAVHIVNAVPADSMNIISTINVKGTVDSLYLDNDILIILYEYSSGRGLTWSGSSPCITVGLSYCTPVETRLGVLITDVSDPSSPDWIKEWIIDGWMVSSRLTGGKLHIVQKFLPDLPPLQQIYDGAEEERDDAVAANKAALKDIPLNGLIPYYDVIDENGSNISGTSPLIIPEDFYRPAESNGGSIISIVTIDLDNPSEDFKSKGLIADAHTVYASTDALYIASSQWNNETVALGGTREYYWTFLYKFSLTGEEVTVEGTGEVRGKILNQFSMSEYDDVLRIATNSMSGTEGVWGVTNESNIYCLESGNDSLDIIGRLEGIAPGEDIYAARFIGPRGFLVTFVKVDPLFTIDLSDPSNPVIAGELHVPGYSDYIHPLGNDHLITIGKDTVLDDFGNVWYQGLQLSIFDVSDFSNPQLLHSELIGDRGTESLALHDHKAFTFWDENGLLAIPVDLSEHETEPAYPYTYGENTFSGLYVYRITTEEGFDYLGRINTDSYSYYSDAWLRGLFIENDVYAVNDEAVRSSNIDNIEETVNTLTFPNSD